MKKYRIILLIIIMVALQAGTALMSQTQEKPVKAKTPTFEKNIEVNYILVDVTVMDGEGKYVRGLKKEDFEVFENGKKVDIATIDEYNSDLQRAEGAESERVQESQPGRNIVLFFDKQFNSVQGLRKSILFAESFLEESFQPNDRVMILDYNKSLHLIQPFTSDKQKILKAMEKAGLKSKKAEKTGEKNPYPKMDDVTRESSDASNSEYTIKKPVVSDIQYEIYLFFKSMMVLSDLLQFIPGRKSLIFFSEGLNYAYIEPQILGIIGKAGGSNYNMVPDYRDLLEELNDGKVSIYTINTLGLNPDSNSVAGRHKSTPMDVTNRRPVF